MADADVFRELIKTNTPIGFALITHREEVSVPYTPSRYCFTVGKSNKSPEHIFSYLSCHSILQQHTLDWFNAELFGLESTSMFGVARGKFHSIAVSGDPDE